MPNAQNRTKPPKDGETAPCRDGCGSLPECAPLSVPFVPFQPESPQRYGRMEALSEGTLFPGLNLPFHLMKNGREVAPCPRTELQALSFVVQELGLYLDTHPEDAEAFTLYQNYTRLLEQGRRIYLEKVGPLVQTDAALDNSYTWVLGPWPWQHQGKED